MPVFQLPADPADLAALLPPDDALRTALHDEVHARPSALVTLPALIVYVAVLNQGVSREQEYAHLRQLPGQDALTLDQLSGNFLRLALPGYTVKWERHTEFTRYSIVQPMPDDALLGLLGPARLGAPAVAAAWLRGSPTFASPPTASRKCWSSRRRAPRPPARAESRSACWSLRPTGSWRCAVCRSPSSSGRC